MRKFLSRVRFAVNGIITGFRTQRNLRIQLIILLAVVVTGLVLQFTFNEWLAILGLSGLVLTTEMINTAIELIVDMVSPEWRKEAGAIKDIAAGAVLISSLFAALAGIFIVLRHLLHTC